MVFTGAEINPSIQPLDIVGTFQSSLQFERAHMEFPTSPVNFSFSPCKV